MDESASTDIFKIDGRRMAGILFLLHGKRWSAVAAVMFLTLFSYGLASDMRWMIVAFMIPFILMPMALAFLYFYHGLSGISVLNSTYHKLEFESSSVRISIYSQVMSDVDENDVSPHQYADSHAPSYPDKDMDSYKKEKNKHEKWKRRLRQIPAAYPELELRSSDVIPYSSIGSYIVGISEVILRMKDPDNGFLVIPAKSLADGTTLSAVMELISQGMNCNQQIIQSNENTEG